MIVKREGLTPERATKEDWQGIIEEFTGKIKSEIGENIISNLESNFTTSYTYNKPSFNNVSNEKVFYI